MAFHASIPGYGELTLTHLILDLNGTLSVDGQVLPGITERIGHIRDELGVRCLLFTGDTHGTAQAIAAGLGLEVRITPDATAKAREAESLSPETTVTIGNGRIDLELFRTVKLSILTLQAEGVHTATLAAADIIVPSILDALDLLLKPTRLIATLRS